jgi:hypothetical protein
MRFRLIPGALRVVLFVQVILAGCDAANSNRPQDKKVQQQEQRLRMAIQKLEAEANRVVLEGKRLYGEASEKVQNFAGQTSQSVKDLSEASERLVQQAKSLQQIPQVVESRSQQMAAAARAAVGHVDPTPVQPTPVQVR